LTKVSVGALQVHDDEAVVFEHDAEWRFETLPLGNTTSFPDPADGHLGFRERDAALGRLLFSAITTVKHACRIIHARRSLDSTGHASNCVDRRLTKRPKVWANPSHYVTF